MEATTTSVYSNASWATLAVGHRLYSNSSCSSYLSSGWWPVNGSSAFSAAKVVYVGAGGVITNIYNCDIF
jgi:hypothetical protein